MYQKSGRSQKLSVQSASLCKRSPHFRCDAGITTKAQRHAAVFLPGLAAELADADNASPLRLPLDFPKSRAQCLGTSWHQICRKCRLLFTFPELTSSCTAQDRGSVENSILMSAADSAAGEHRSKGCHRPWLQKPMPWLGLGPALALGGGTLAVWVSFSSWTKCHADYPICFDSQPCCNMASTSGSNGKSSRPSPLADLGRSWAVMEAAIRVLYPAFVWGVVHKVLGTKQPPSLKDSQARLMLSRRLMLWKQIYWILYYVAKILLPAFPARKLHCFQTVPKRSTPSSLFWLARS